MPIYKTTNKQKKYNQKLCHVYEYYKNKLQYIDGNAGDIDGKNVNEKKTK